MPKSKKSVQDIADQAAQDVADISTTDETVDVLITESPPDAEITEDTAEDALAGVELPLEPADSEAEGEPMAHPGHDQADDDYVAVPEEG